MALDVGGDGGREQAGTRVAAVKAVAEVGGRDILVDRGEEMDAGALGGGERKGCELGFGEREVGAADDDPLGHREEVVWFAPTAQGKKAVGSGQGEEECGGILVRECGESVDGIVR